MGDGRWEMRSMQDRDGKFNLNFEYYILTRRVEAAMMQEVKIEVLNLKVQNKYFCTQLCLTEYLYYTFIPVLLL